MLWHHQNPVGIVIFSTPRVSIRHRTRFFQLTNTQSQASLAGLNDQLWLLQRVVLHPSYRGAGIASLFIRRACELCPVPWIETLTALGHIHPCFEQAGFQRRGTVAAQSPKAFAPANPIYYIFDNRNRFNESLSPTVGDTPPASAG
ncbi:MAG: hypothetical protein ACRCZF_07420 [Gemmataceae bacterium]